MRFLSLSLMLLLLACAGSDGRSDADTTTAAGTAATPASANDDIAELSEYELTMDKVDKFYDATRRMGEAFRDIPEDQRPNLNAASASLDEMVRRMEGEPRIRRALDDADISAREYVTVMMTMMQAGMAYGVTQMRPNDNADSLARAMSTNPKNVRFMREHEAELRAKQEQMAKTMGEGGR